MDTSLQALTRTINKLGEAFEAFKDTNDERIKALESGDEGKASELGRKVGKIEIDLGKFTKLKSDIEVEMKAQTDRIEELESRRNLPGLTSPLNKTQEEYKTNFFSYLRAAGPGNIMRKAEFGQKMNDLAKQARQQAEHEQKAVIIGSLTEGGYAVPEEIQREIERLELKYSPVRRLVRVRTVGTSDYKELVDEAGQEAGWAGEETTRAETASGTIRQRAPTMGELYAYPKTSLFALEDIFFNVQAWLTEGVARAFAVAEGTAVISGNGTDKPTGMLNTTPVIDDDFASPLRDNAAYEYLASSSSPVALAGDDLIDLVYSTNSAYRVNGTWVMNSLTTAAVRKLKTTDGAYHWAPGLQPGQPNLLLGYPVECWEQMQDVGVNNFPIAFGDWSRAYVLVDRVGMSLFRDEITQPGFVKFYIRRRVGGTVLNNDAIKFLGQV